MSWGGDGWSISNPKRWCCESAALDTPANLENSSGHRTAVAVFIPTQKKGNAKERSNYHTVAVSSHTQNSPSQASTVSEPWTSRCSRWILKRQRKQRSNCEHQQDHQKKQESSRKYIFLLYWLCQSLCVDHNILWKILKETRIPDNLTCLLGNLYAGQEAMVRIRDGTTDWFQIRKGVCRDWILSPYLFYLYAEYIMGNARQNEAQAGIKTARRNIHNLRYADDMTLI